MFTLVALELLLLFFPREQTLAGLLISLLATPICVLMALTAAAGFILILPAAGSVIMLYASSGYIGVVALTYAGATLQEAVRPPFTIDVHPPTVARTPTAPAPAGCRKGRSLMSHPASGKDPLASITAAEVRSLPRGPGVRSADPGNCRSSKPDAGRQEREEIVWH